RVEREVLLQRPGIRLACAGEIVLLLQQRADGVLEQRFRVVEVHEIFRVMRPQLGQRELKLREGTVHLSRHSENPSALDAEVRLELRGLLCRSVQSERLVKLAVAVRDPGAELRAFTVASEPGLYHALRLTPAHIRAA